MSNPSAGTLYVRHMANEPKSQVFQVVRLQGIDQIRLYKSSFVGQVVAVRKAEDLATVHTPVLLAMFNAARKAAGEEPLARFRDRATAEQRTFEVIAQLEVPFVPNQGIQKMTDQKQAEQDKAAAKAQREQEKADAKAKREQEREAAKAKKQAEKDALKAAKGPGVIGTIREFVTRRTPFGATIDEMLDELVQRFPERDREQMQTTCRIQVSRLQKDERVGTISSALIEGRGRVYANVKNPADIPGPRPAPVEKPAPAPKPAKTAAKTAAQAEVQDETVKSATKPAPTATAAPAQGPAARRASADKTAQAAKAKA